MFSKTFIAGMALLALLAKAAAPAFAQTGHEGHNHGAAGGHTHGTPSDLGTTSVLGINLTVAQFGNILTSTEGAFEVVVGKGSKPKAMRLWIGHESAEGSVKTKAESTTDVYDVHIEIPKKLKKTSQLWIEIEPTKGKKQKVAFDLKF